eukprot:416418_1
MIEEGSGADQMEEGPGADKVKEGSGASMIKEGPGADKMEVDGPPSGDESPVQNGMDDSTEGINEKKKCNEKPAKRRKTEDNQSEAEKSATVSRRPSVSTPSHAQLAHFHAAPHQRPVRSLRGVRVWVADQVARRWFQFGSGILRRGSRGAHGAGIGRRRCESRGLRTGGQRE